MSSDYVGLNGKNEYPREKLKRDFLEKESRVVKGILEWGGKKSVFYKFSKLFSNKIYFQAFYDNLVLSLTNKNYTLCSKLSKRLVSPYEFSLGEN